MTQWRFFSWFVLSVVMLPLMFVGAKAQQQQIIGAGFTGQSIDIINTMQLVASPNPKAVIDVPVDATGQKIRMNLEATRPRTSGQYRWAVFTLSNPDLVTRDFVLQIPRQGFINSGVLWPKKSAIHVVSVSASTGPRPVLVSSRNAQNYALSLAPGRTASFALELTGISLNKVTLWHRDVYEDQAGQSAFFNGAVLGIAILLGVAIFSLFVVRPMAIFPAAGLFAWSLIVFMLLNTGFLSLVTSEAFEQAYEPNIRGFVESMMVAGLALSLITFLQLSKTFPVANIGFAIATAISVILAALSFFDPLMASGLARITFAVVAFTGLVTAVVLWFDRVSRAGSTLVVWAIVFAWTILAAFGCLGVLDGGFLEPAIAAGQGLILITISFTLVQMVFGQSIAANHFLEDSGRRALALAGSEQSVWDWQVFNQILYVGPELERALGLQQGIMGRINFRRWEDMIHPTDRGGYISTIEAAEKRGKGAFSQEFRLRRADGAYRWYLLRARAIMGDNGFASRLIGTLTDVTAVKRSEERLLADAVRDRVTGLPNRALFVDRLERAMRRVSANSNENNEELYVLVIDLDRFKSVNDGLGHEIGDSLLNVTGTRLGQMVGPQDTLARLAGDQFGIIFNGETPEREIVEVVDNIAEIVSVPINVRPREIFLTASIGIARFEQGLNSPDEMIKNAEIALYEAKRQGKNQVEFYQQNMRDDRSQLVALESDLRRALERNEIEVVYQPIKRLVDDQLAGFEALVRWRHPELGLLSPDKFMDIAEETGIIREVGRYVLNEAARKLGTWQRAFRQSDPLFVAVNVSRVQLLNYELIGDLRALLGREDIVPGTLKLEVTETMVMQNPELASKVLERASELGIGIACDDFGTGYSALANLARLPFDTLKIDRAFLHEDGVSENATTIFDAITHLAHDLNLNVVAEGVESQEQLDRLQARGVDYAQGFFIGEPVSAGRVIEALGGEPYVSETPQSKLSWLWDRLLGNDQSDQEETSESSVPPASQLVNQHIAKPVNMPPPWEPSSDDVSDPALETDHTEKEKENENENENEIEDVSDELTEAPVEENDNTSKYEVPTDEVAPPVSADDEEQEQESEKEVEVEHQAVISENEEGVLTTVEEARQIKEPIDTVPEENNLSDQPASIVPPTASKTGVNLFLEEEKKPVIGAAPLAPRPQTNPVVINPLKVPVIEVVTPDATEKITKQEAEKTHTEPANKVLAKKPPVKTKATNRPKPKKAPAKKGRAKAKKPRKRPAKKN